MFTFKIDQNDEKYAITDGGCVDDKICTLNTSDVKLHYNSNFVDFTDSKHSKMILCSKYDNNLFQNSSCVMCGSVISSKEKKLLISFGGLIGEFTLKEPSELPDEAIYLYIS